MADQVKHPVIVAARRTAMGSFLGGLTDCSAAQLGAATIAAVVQDAAVPGEQVDEVIMGCVLPAGVGQAPARQASRAAGLPDSVPCTTLNKVCGSGMKAVMIGTDMIRAGSARAIIAGGMESMSNAPYLLPKVRSGYRFGQRELLDHMLYDGLQNADDGQVMGVFGQRCSDRYQFTREQQDAYATESVLRARAAIESGAFAEEICSVTIWDRKGEHTINRDEEPLRCDPEKIPHMKPAFSEDAGTVTAASAASLADGAAALLLLGHDFALECGVQPLATVIAQAGFAQAPEDFTTAPIGAIERVLQRAGWQKDDVDLFEINEAFASVAMAAIHDLKLDPQRVNVLGGACALGHPIGATGARLLVTLVHALRGRGLHRGVAALCIGGGEATAVAIEC